MQALGPFDPLALSAGLFTSLAYDILKHRVQSASALEGTLVGKMLKWAGIMEPNFDERLRDTLSKTLSVYFKEHPAYALSGVAAFFQDAAVSQQIADYILDRRPIDYVQLESTFEQHFDASNSVSKILFQRRGLSSKQVVNDFFLSYRRVLGEQLSIPQMGLLLDMLDQTTTTVNEIQASEQRLKDYITALLETRLSPDVLKVAYEQGQQQLVQDLTTEVRGALGSLSTGPSPNSRRHLATSGGRTNRGTTLQRSSNNACAPNAPLLVHRWAVRRLSFSTHARLLFRLTRLCR